MRKIIQTVVFSVLILSLNSCGEKKAEPSKSEIKKGKKLLAKDNLKPVSAKPIIQTKSRSVITEKKSDDRQKESMSPEQLAKASELIKSTSSSDIASVDAKRKFKMYCASCHGFKGNLNVNGAKDLTKSSISLEESIAQVYFGKGLMSPFKGMLKDKEIVALAKYIETEIRN